MEAMTGCFHGRGGLTEELFCGLCCLSESPFKIFIHKLPGQFHHIKHPFRKENTELRSWKVEKKTEKEIRSKQLCVYVQTEISVNIYTLNIIPASCFFSCFFFNTKCCRGTVSLHTRYLSRIEKLLKLFILLHTSPKNAFGLTSLLPIPPYLNHSC